MMERKPYVNKKVPTFAVDHKLGWVHVGTSDAEVEAMVREAIANDARARSDRPRLARLEARQDGLHQVERWVDWEQPIEVIHDFTQEEEDQRQAEIAAYDRSL